MSRLGLFALAALCSPLGTIRADDLDREPIRYDTAPAVNAISRLEARLAADSKLLRHEDEKSFLRGLLDALEIPISSQTLVFSRTSLQRQKISPERPRAIYFRDDLYIGACQNSPIFEISAVDPNLGAVFYTAEFRPGARPKFVRQNDTCMSCHGSSANSGLPSHLIRSVYPDAEGDALLSLGSYRVDQRTPLKNRWGGWYVSGTSGKQTHLGNRTYQGEGDRDVVDPAAQNRKRIDDLFDARRYPSPDSDIVALLVLEHQVEMQNLLTRANIQIRQSIHHDRALNKELGESEGTMSTTTWRRMHHLTDQVVKFMLMGEEAPLVDPIAGTTTFARDFAAKGPRDPAGRSLRDLDLKTRLFKYPCSYLIYSEQFEGLPAEMKDAIRHRLHQVLIGRDTRQMFAQVSADDRRAILEILRATAPGPWRE